ncbi:hypothetical protein PoB_002682100 [Plakobranchus ocellatus]|uniref:Uncharacterized protein n=1 Tax=Plakobranchus ocellatus TaxID=259542 RepID=A0AAV4A0N6_9GAST|nr:hypothetical protein PoB_002682100 [Plakobranchus ocellatus]
MIPVREACSRIGYTVPGTTVKCPNNETSRQNLGPAQQFMTYTVIIVLTRVLKTLHTVITVLPRVLQALHLLSLTPTHCHSPDR